MVFKELDFRNKVLVSNPTRLMSDVPLVKVLSMYCFINNLP